MQVQNIGGATLEVPNASVIAEPFPHFVNGFGGSRHQGFDGRKCFHPSVPVRKDCFYLRLLEHDLGNPDCIRIRGVSPRKVPGMAMKPVDEYPGAGEARI